MLSREEPCLPPSNPLMVDPLLHITSLFPEKVAPSFHLLGWVPHSVGRTPVEGLGSWLT